jgi:opacity protein-like surface antigen
MISRRQFMPAAVAIVAVAAMLPTAVAAAATQPPSALFRPGYNLCHAVSLASIRKAGGEHYKRGVFLHNACTWERSDLTAGIVLSTHPTKVGRALMRMFKAQSGKQHIVARTVSVPQASKALLVTLPSGTSSGHTKYLFAEYPRGVIQVNMTAPGSLTATRIEGVLGVIVRR